MTCGLLPLCYDAMALGEVPFCDVDGDQQQLTAAIGSASKVSSANFGTRTHLYSADYIEMAESELILQKHTDTVTKLSN